MGHFFKTQPKSVGPNPTQPTEASTQPYSTRQRHLAWLETETSNDQTSTYIALHVNSVCSYVFTKTNQSKTVSHSHSTQKFHSSPVLMLHLRRSTDSTLFADSADLASVTVRPTDERSLSDCAELLDVLNSRRRGATEPRLETRLTVCSRIPALADWMRALACLCTELTLPQHSHGSCCRWCHPEDHHDDHGQQRKDRGSPRSVLVAVSCRGVNPTH